VCVVSWISKTVKIRAKKEYNWITNSAKVAVQPKKTFAFLILISYDYMND
jgi:hypothetical protein